MQRQIGTIVMVKQMWGLGGGRGWENKGTSRAPLSPLSMALRLILQRKTPDLEGGATGKGW